jgi:hypothetical protein
MSKKLESSQFLEHDEPIIQKGDKISQQKSIIISKAKIESST